MYLHCHFLILKNQNFLKKPHPATSRHPYQYFYTYFCLLFKLASFCLSFPLCTKKKEKKKSTKNIGSVKENFIMAQNPNKAVEEVLVGAIQNVEKQLDEEIDRLNNLQEDDLESIRKRRLAEMKKQAEDKAMWRRNGHGTLHHITEKDFFSRAKSAPRMIAIFFRPGTSRYANDVIDHLSRLAQSHLESLFVSLDAEKSPFLCTRLSIRILPSIVMLKDGEIDLILQGLDGLSPSGKFSTISIEKRLFDYQMVTDTNIADNA